MNGPQEFNEFNASSECDAFDEINGFNRCSELNALYEFNTLPFAIVRAWR